MKNALIAGLALIFSFSAVQTTDAGLFRKCARKTTVQSDKQSKCLKEYQETLCFINTNFPDHPLRCKFLEAAKLRYCSCLKLCTNSCASNVATGLQMEIPPARAVTCFEKYAECMIDANGDPGKERLCMNAYLMCPPPE